MLKKITVLCLVFLMLFLTSGCGGSKDVKTNLVNNENENSSNEFVENENKDEIKHDESKTRKEIEKIESEFFQGNMKEAEYHSKKVEVLILFNERIENKDELVKKNQDIIPIDLSYDLQWMSDNYNNLDKNQKEIFDKLNKLYINDEKEGVFLNTIIKKVYADEVEESYEADFNDRVKFYAENIADGIIYQPIIYEAYEKCSGKYNEFFKTELNSKISITVAPFDLALESFSYEFMDGYHIYINSNINTDFMVGSLYHEMFHAYQVNLGYNRFNKLKNFIMESTAIWAVTYVDEDLGYHIRYSDQLYSNPTLDIENMTTEDIYSWYQLYYFIYQEKGDLELTQSIILNMVNETDFAKGLTKILGKELRMHNLMAFFGQYLFAESGLSDITFKDSSLLGNFTFDDNVLNDTDIISFAEIKDENGWCQESIDKFGYKIYHVSTEADKDAVLSIVSDIGDKESETDKKAGMIVFGKKNEKWILLLNGRYDTFTTSVDFMKDNIDDLMVILFSYNSLDSVTHAIKWNYEDLISGEGSINLNVKVDINGDRDVNSVKYINQKEYEIRIIEDIEKYKSEPNEELQGYDSLILGDIYQVSNLQAIYDGYEEFYTLNDIGESREIIKESYGVYDYNDGDLGDGAFENNLLNLPPLPGINGNDSNSLIDDASEMLKGIEGMPGLEGIADMGVELDQLNVEINEIDGLETIKNILAPIGSLIRIKKDEAINTFHIYNALPNTIQSEKWIHLNEEATYIDADGEVRNSHLESDTELSGVIFKTWFNNSFYDPDIANSSLLNIDMTPAELADEYKNSEDIMNKVATMNGLFDKSNLYKTINNGPSRIDMTLINPNYDGEQIQEIKFEDNVLSGYIEASYTNERGDEFEVDIEFNYDFR